MVILKHCVMSACAIAVIGVVAAAASSVGRIKSFHGGSDQGYSYFAGFQPFMGLPTGWQSKEKVWPYLDENKHLILAILDNQNLGKLNECATFQARLQHNLMYLAAIADAQPQTPSPTLQARSSAMVQHGQQQYNINYGHQQQQQIMHQPMLGQRNPLSYLQPSTQTLLQHSPQVIQQQQFLHASPSGFIATGNTGLHFNMPPDSGIGGNLNPPAGSFHDFSHGSGACLADSTLQSNMGLNGNRPPDHISAANAAGGGSGSGPAGQVPQESESPFLNVTEDGS